jgi:hypothetical protein
METISMARVIFLILDTLRILRFMPVMAWVLIFYCAF